MLLIVCFVVTGLVIPAALDLERWIELEIVLVVWWLIWVIVLTRMLYVGKRVEDDHQMGKPRSWFGWMKSDSGDVAFSFGDALSSIGDGEGCLVLLALPVLLFVLLVGAWFLVELAIPALAFLMYLLVRGMLAHAVNDRHECRGNLGRSLLWALIWATVYTAPLALAVWGFHQRAASTS